MIPPPSLWSHIACCMDDSPGSAAALAEARRLRAQDTGRLSLVHVVYGPPGEAADAFVEEAQSWLEQAAAGTPSGDAVVLTSLGRPGGAIGAWAGDNEVDLLDASAHRGILERAMLGSFAEYLARHAPCPVLLVRPATER